MKKLLLLALTLSVLLSLAACIVAPGGSGGDPDPGYKGDGTVYSATVPVSVLISADNELSYVTVYTSEIYDKLYGAGFSVKRKADTSAIAESEIAIGETDRAASKYLYERFATEGGEDYVSFGICYKDGTLAIGGNSELSLGLAVEYFFAELYSATSLKVDTDYLYFVNKTYDKYLSDLYADGRAENMASWETRFLEASEVLDRNGLDALIALYSLYDGDVVDWMASMWDNEIGGFYYSVSALAYEGFLPDLESTRQALAIIKNTGFVDAYDLTGNGNLALRNALPDEMEAKILAFVRSMQSETDGYFYHPQWSTAGDARRGRDLDWAIEIFGMLGAKPLYPTALDRLSGTTATSAVAKVVASASRGPPAHLQSEESFEAYLDSFDIKANSHNSGHTIASQTSQIKAAGLIDFACDYFDRIQDEIREQQIAEGKPVNGLWQMETNVVSVTGLYKIGGLYNAANREIRYADVLVESCIECILSYELDDERLSDIIWIFNPWAAMNMAFGSMKRAEDKYDIEESYAKVRENATQLISIAANNLSYFKRDDGGFSYYRQFSNPVMQGSPAGLGLAEGDYNATNIAVHSIPGMVTNCLGISSIARFNCEDLDSLLEQIETAGAVSKLPVDYSKDDDFDDIDEGDTPIGYAGFEAVKMSVDGVENTAILLSSPANTNASGSISLGIEQGFTAAYFEADMMIAKGANGYTHQIYFQGDSAAEKMYLITVKVSGGMVNIADASSNTGTPITTNTGISFPVDEWHNLRWEVYIFTDDMGERTVRTKIFLDGDFVAVSDNYWGKQDGTQPAVNMKKMYFFTLKAPASDLYLDNVVSNVIASPEWSMDGYKPLVSDTVEIDFDDNNERYSTSLGYTGSTAELVDSPDGGDGKALKITKVDNNAAGVANVFDTYSFTAPGITASTFSFTTDIYLESVTGSTAAVYQLCFGTFGSKSVYMMTFNLRNGGFYLGDSWNTGSSQIANDFEDVYAFNEWHTLTVEITVTDDPDEFFVTIYMDDNEYTSTNYYNKDKIEGAAPATSIPVVEMRALKNTKGSIYFDNIYMAFFD